MNIFRLPNHKYLALDFLTEVEDEGVINNSCYSVRIRMAFEERPRDLVIYTHTPPRSVTATGDEDYAREKEIQKRGRRAFRRLLMAWRLTISFNQSIP